MGSDCRPCQTAAMPPEKLSWKHLYQEVVTSGLCTGCAGCVIACPHDVLGYRDAEGVYKPFQLEDDYGGAGDCSQITRTDSTSDRLVTS